MDILKGVEKRWLVTGCAGFIGSNLAETLLKNNQHVVGVDSLLTGHAHNIEGLQEELNDDQRARFKFIEGDLKSVEFCESITQDVDLILHQAALGSVPRSIAHPIDSHTNNVDTFANLLASVRQSEKVKRIVYASSSSVYGDHPALPKVEEQTGNVLSPYALTKQSNEDYAKTFASVYGMELIGLRYFNVYGRRQDPDGPYAAVIPKWVQALIHNQPVAINGDGETSRDFTHVENVVQINIRAALTDNSEALNRAYNVALGERTTLNELYQTLKNLLGEKLDHVRDHQPTYRDFRPGDIRHSQADIGAAVRLLGYVPSVNIEQGLAKTLDWYVEHLS